MWFLVGFAAGAYSYRTFPVVHSYIEPYFEKIDRIATEVKKEFESKESNIRSPTAKLPHSPNTPDKR